ncbi:hypothetical protein C8P66_11150 [Humitalea rosea]|uniref:Polysaccharide biosynthesis enzyme WcbI domain-containing protein n=1 Tax=Humitalea rosea TaxID=990373 RepID=A0A2W7J3P4_9PROT|nr:WcbI family polysaccharide biosynthesis putative acetyltransferase [Humitalea rosea]PZW45635.1 hypothetical protein C8P66_11150 [Humitalea rosea]
MKIGILGNCQTAGFVASLNALAPGHELTVVRLDTNDRNGDLEAHASNLSACDLLLTQPVHDAPSGPLRTDLLVPRAHRALIFPAFSFRGFHPDRLIYQGTTGSATRGPTDPCHSAIVMACFLEGLSPQRAIRLFNAFTYASLGYFDAYEGDLQQATAMLAKYEVSFDEVLRRASRYFMHSPVHPRIEIIFGIAKATLQRAGLPVRDAAVPDDTFVEPSKWPVYPEIAERLGIAGSLEFECHFKTRDLPTMVEQAYAAYATWTRFEPVPVVERARNFLREQGLGTPVAPIRLAPALTPQDVKQAYRLILGRECERDEVAEFHAKAFPTLAQLREVLLRSKEFQITVRPYLSQP